MTLEQKKELAIKILQEKMTDEEFDEFSRDWIDIEELVEKIKDTMTNIWEESELDEFLTNYNY
jgi:hypothetical protein